MMDSVIKLQHGCGGKPTARLIEDVFYKSFGNEILLQGYDSALLSLQQQSLAFTTDSFIVSPSFFQGGNIGKLAVCGTANDLAVCGAKPLYLSCGMIIEEGFDMSKLKEIADSMAETAEGIGMKIVTGDTKIVEKGNADGIYINTSGIGTVMNGYVPKKIADGDAIIVSGEIGEHGTIVALNRFSLPFSTSLKSDCAPVYSIVEHLQPYFKHIKLMKDPTRGGIATSINEIAASADLGVKLSEQKVPIKQEVRAVCDMLGMDPLYLACEGRLLLVAEGHKAEAVLMSMKQLQCCADAAIIGYFENKNNKLVYIENVFGSKRILPSLEGDLLPRIC